MKKVQSFTDPGVYYMLDTDVGVCSCPKFQNSGTCKHLEAYGVFQSKPFFPKARPTFSQALSGLVKSIRIRRVEDAVYWLHYLRTFLDKEGAPFRVSRRLLIGAAEDGHCIDVMQTTANNLKRMIGSTHDHLVFQAAEAVRICAVPNWWHAASGGPNYIYAGLRAWRGVNFFHVNKGRTFGELLNWLRAGIERKDPVMGMTALEAIIANQEQYGIGRTVLAERLKLLAQGSKSEEALALVEIHLRHKGPLSGDANFLGQAVWWMCGGVAPVAHAQVTVTSSSVMELLLKAEERWRSPEPIPHWACDGIHCAGQDRRFAGMWDHMHAVCKAFAHYGRVEPSDEWLPEFWIDDGLHHDDYAWINEFSK